MSDVTPTMKYVDHKASASVNIDTVQLPASNNELLTGLIHKFLEEVSIRDQALQAILAELLDKPIPAPVVNVESPVVKMPDSLKLESPVLNAVMPSVDIPQPVVHVSVNLFSPKVTVIIVAIMLIQLVTIGVSLWR